MNYKELAKNIISGAMDELGIQQQNCGVSDPHFHTLMAKVDELAEAHRVLEEEGYLNKRGRVTVAKWLRENVAGVHPEDISEAAGSMFNGDMAAIGGLYMLVEHSWHTQVPNIVE